MSNLITNGGFEVSAGGGTVTDNFVSGYGYYTANNVGNWYSFNGGRGGSLTAESVRGGGYDHANTDDVATSPDPHWSGVNDSNAAVLTTGHSASFSAGSLPRARSGLMQSLGSGQAATDGNGDFITYSFSAQAAAGVRDLTGSDTTMRPNTNTGLTPGTSNDSGAVLEIWGQQSAMLQFGYGSFVDAETSPDFSPSPQNELWNEANTDWVLLATVQVPEADASMTETDGSYSLSDIDVSFTLQGTGLTELGAIAILAAWPTNGGADDLTTADGILIDDVGLQVACFHAGTMIESLQGKIAIENLKAGDVVVSRDAGMSRIQWLGSSKFSAQDVVGNPNLHPVRIAKGALGDDMPDEDLLVSQQHRVLIKGPLVKKMFGEDEILTKAKNLIGFPGIELVNIESEIEYYHLMLEQHDIVYSNNAPTESFYPGPEIVKNLGDQARGELCAMLGSSPEHAAQTKMPLARKVPEKNSKVRNLVLRLHKNGKPVLTGEPSRESFVSETASETPLKGKANRPLNN